MPTYDFRCANGHQFEQFHTMKDVPATVPCPECGTESERLISAGAGLMFKGSGFYLTDYGKNAHRGTPVESKGDAGTSESKSDSKVESKSDSKAESKSESKSEQKSESKPAPEKPPPKPAKKSEE